MSELFEHKGEIQVIFGPMFSGKTTELLRRIRRYQIRNNSCIVIKTPESRYDEELNQVVSHDLTNSLEAISSEKLTGCLTTVFEYQVIGIDEGQFFPDLVEFCDEMANRGKVVIVACLDADFKRNPFGNVCNLIPKAEKVCKLRSICTQCKKSAAFTARLTNETEVKVIGGLEKYKPVCRSCYFAISKRNFISK